MLTRDQHDDTKVALDDTLAALNGDADESDAAMVLDVVYTKLQDEVDRDNDPDAALLVDLLERLLAEDRGPSDATKLAQAALLVLEVCTL